jgi:hypothetical protein
MYLTLMMMNVENILDLLKGHRHQVHGVLRSTVCKEESPLMPAVFSNARLACGIKDYYTEVALSPQRPWRTGMKIKEV